MSKPERFKNALIIQEGASNRRLISRKLTEAVVECSDEGKNPDDCPACFLILHQLAWLLTSHDIARDHEQYQRSISACQREVADHQSAWTETGVISGNATIYP